jgi:hypothetical protein
MSEGGLSRMRLRFCSPVAEWGSGGEFEGNPWGLMGSPQSLFIAQRFLMADLVVPLRGVRIAPLTLPEIPVTP